MTTPSEPIRIDSSQWPNSEGCVHTLIDRALAELSADDIEAAKGLVHFHLTDEVFIEVDLETRTINEKD